MEDVIVAYADKCGSWGRNRVILSDLTQSSAPLAMYRPISLL